MLEILGMGISLFFALSFSIVSIILIGYLL
jgi:hypothetical protein